MAKGSLDNFDRDGEHAAEAVKWAYNNKSWCLGETRAEKVKAFKAFAREHPHWLKRWGSKKSSYNFHAQKKRLKVWLKDATNGTYC